jgi:hypothetical protein
LSGSELVTALAANLQSEAADFADAVPVERLLTAAAAHVNPFSEVAVFPDSGDYRKRAVVFLSERVEVGC